MTLTLTPELGRRLTAYAQHRQKPVEAVLDELVPDVPTQDQTLPETWQETFARWKQHFEGHTLPDLPPDAFSRASFYGERG